MNAIPLSQIAQWSGGSLLAGSPGLLATRICTDSRTIAEGDFFVALRGEKYDGHEYVVSAVRMGAVGALVENAMAGLPDTFGVVGVKDTLAGLQSLAANYRASLSLKVIGITGSNGKTSTKDFTHAVLSQHFRAAKTEGNLNNHIGVPLTLLRLDSEQEVAVVEMGMNHPGEIAPLAAMTKPDIAIITNVGIAHIEFMGSREAIAREKGALAEAVPPGGTVILCADDDMSPSIAKRCSARVVTAGISSGDVRATDLTPFSSGTKFRLHATGRYVQAELPVPGEHMVRNALLACAAGLSLGLTLEECAAGLASPHLTKGRLQSKQVGGITLLDDTYNANPDSVAAGLATLVQIPGIGRRIAILGVMGELGAEAEAGHRRVGKAAADSGIACLIAIGGNAGWIAEAARDCGLAKVIHVEGIDEAVAALRGFVREGDIVLVKGSRSAKLERVVEALEEGVAV